MNTKITKLQQSKLAEIKELSLTNRTIVQQFYSKNELNLMLVAGKRQVEDILKKQSQKVVLVILWSEVTPEYLHDTIKQLAILNNCPIYYSGSQYFVSNLINKKHAASCGVILSNKTYTEFQQYIVKSNE